MQHHDHARPAGQHGRPVHVHRVRGRRRCDHGRRAGNVHRHRVGVDVRTGRRDLAWLGGLVLLLLVVFLWPYVVDGYRFGVGPDVPVYLWWTRVGASEGLSAIGSRPGAPALAAALAGTLQLNAAT